jgi:hypothetical protein
MDKLVVTIILWLFVSKGDRIKKALEILFSEEDNTVTKTKPQDKIKPSNNKRDEIIQAINFLKNKPNKTKQDKDKIQMLEVILKSQRVNSM